MMPSINKTLVLKILILIGVLGIFASLYVKYGQPYLKERSLYTMDEKRIKDLDTLNKAIEDILATSSTTKLGEDNTVYISIPSDDPNCGDLDLPSLAEGWKYHCSSKENYQKTDGTGWIPVKLEKIKKLHIDPKNDIINFFSYITDRSTYTLNATMNSRKGTSNIKDDGSDPLKFEIGPSTNLEAQSKNLIGTWLLQNVKGNTLRERFDNSLDGTIIGGPIQDSYGVIFNGQNFVTIGTNDFINSIGKPNVNFSIELWIKDLDPIDQSLTEKWESEIKYPWAIRVEKNSLVFAIYDGNTWLAASAKLPKLSTNWQQIIATKDSTNIKLYLNGTLIAQTRLPLEKIDTSNSSNFTIGSRNSKGLMPAHVRIGQLKIYKTALNDKTILRTFTEMKNNFFY